MSTSNFPEFARRVSSHFAEMAMQDLFVADIDPMMLWDIYLNSFPEGTNPIFRVRTEHDGSIDRNFIRDVGAVVSIDSNLNVTTLWDLPDLPYPYNVVAERLSQVIRQKPIAEYFYAPKSYKKRGAQLTRIMLDGVLHTFNHFFCEIPSKYLSDLPDTARSNYRANYDVLRRSLEETTGDALDSVIDLINDNAIYRGAEFRAQVTEFRNLFREYDKLTPYDRDRWLHRKANSGGSITRFRNTVIGTLVTDISKGVGIEDAVRMFESKVAPLNYKRPTSLITPKMIDQAIKTLETLGLSSAINRRHAMLSDVSVNNVLWVNNEAKQHMRNSLSDLLMKSSSVVTKTVKPLDATSISISEFLSSVIPKAKSISMMLENSHLNNFMSVTAPANDDQSERLFKWDNNFAWSYDGDFTDSVKERVKAAGGKIDAPFRISLAWYNLDDLDLHVRTPWNTLIYFGNRFSNGGTLDVDMNAWSPTSRTPVENVVFNSLVDGTYTVIVDQYNYRESTDIGFTLEVEIGGVIHQFQHPSKATKGFRALQITIAKGKIVNIVTGPGVSGGNLPQTKWGMTTNQLVPISLIMLSPNHWDGQGVGNKHWFFILENCKNPEPVRGIYNEFLREDLAEHRKVFEILGAKTKAPFSDNQLSGVGFSSTKPAEATFLVDNRTYTVNF